MTVTVAKQLFIHLFISVVWLSDKPFHILLINFSTKFDLNIKSYKYLLSIILMIITQTPIIII